MQPKKMEAKLYSSFLMSTRIIHGIGALGSIGQTAAAMGLGHVLIITDTNITPQPFYAAALRSLADAGVRVTIYDGCGIDAHLAEVDEQAARVLRETIDGVVAIGGGSVMCVAKAVAIVANNPPSFRACAGVAGFANPARKMILVPTTAGSGAEVSQFTLVKDDERQSKFVGGGPLSFPDVAILDPVVLSAIPEKLAAVSAVDALTHAVEAMFTEFATPLTDGLAATAVSLLIRSVPDAIRSRSESACAENLLGSAIANMACGNARLGLAHALSLPLEAQYHLPHGYGVGVLLPRVLRFNAEVMPGKVEFLAQAMGVGIEGLDAAGIATAVIVRIRSFYSEIGFPQDFVGVLSVPSSLAEVARAAVPGLYGSPPSGAVNDSTIIASPNIRKATVSEAVPIYRSCFEPIVV